MYIYIYIYTIADKKKILLTYESYFLVLLRIIFVINCLFQHSIFITFCKHFKTSKRYKTATLLFSLNSQIFENC